MKVRFIALALVFIATGATSSVAQGNGQANDNESLSTKLSKSSGVIAPKTDIDPGIKVPAPDPHPGSTPVIPPSATGGNSAK